MGILMAPGPEFSGDEVISIAKATQRRTIEVGHSDGSKGSSRGISDSSSGDPVGAQRRLRSTAVVRRIGRLTMSRGGGSSAEGITGRQRALDGGRTATPASAGSRRWTVGGNRRLGASDGGRSEDRRRTTARNGAMMHRVGAIRGTRHRGTERCTGASRLDARTAPLVSSGLAATCCVVWPKPSREMQP